MALGQARPRCAARFARLDRDHPVGVRADRAQTYKTRLLRTAALVGKTIRPSLYAKKSDYIRAGTDLRKLGKGKAAEKHREFVQSLDRSKTLVAYSDGSQCMSKEGWGAIAYHKDLSLSAHGVMTNSEVYERRPAALLKR